MHSYWDDRTDEKICEFSGDVPRKGDFVSLGDLCDRKSSQVVYVSWGVEIRDSVTQRHYTSVAEVWVGAVR